MKNIETVVNAVTGLNDTSIQGEIIIFIINSIKAKKSN